MFLTGRVTLGMAMALLIVHGLAGVIWIPASQVLIHQIVSPEQLPSAVRINATGRYLGVSGRAAPRRGALARPGSGLRHLRQRPDLHAAAPVAHQRAVRRRGARGAVEPQAPVGSFADIWSTMRVVAHNRVLLSMTVLVGAASFFVGNAYQAQMPGFASDLGHQRADFAYGMLLAADALGGLIGGVILETRGLLPPRVRTAFVLAMIWCAALAAFARSSGYASCTRAVVRGRIRRARIQFDGAGARSDQRAE